MTLLAVGVTVVVLVWVYIVFLRERLLEGTWIHRIEDKLWAKSRQILIARLYVVGGIVVFVHDYLAAQGFDYTPITQQITDRVPEKYRPFALLVYFGLTGLLYEWLRRTTTSSSSLPVDQKWGS